MKNTALICWIFLITLQSFAQDRSVQFDSIFKGLYDADKFTGNVLIAENGVPVFQKSYGKAFREKNLDLNGESVFELASIGKQFTAMAIMILKEQGKLSYEDSLRHYFPELPYKNISIRNMLNHTSGLPDYMDLAYKSWDTTTIITNKDMIQLLASKKPEKLFLPGEKWEYSNTGYALLASIVEKVSGQSFKNFMSQHIYQPLDMKRTQVYHKRWENRTIDNYAYGYVKDDNLGYIMADSSAIVGNMVYFLDGIYGDGITNSTTTDLLKWDQALYSEALVSRAIMQEAFTPVTLNNGKSFDYGFGWLLADSNDFGSYMFHSGGWPGYATYIERHPKTNKTIIILANAGAANEKVKSIRHILFDIPEKSPVEIKLERNVLQEYIGIYEFGNKETVKIILDDDKLFAEGGGQIKHQLFPESPELFFRKDRDYKTKFIKDLNGKIGSLLILREGPSIEAIKIQ